MAFCKPVAPATMATASAQVPSGRDRLNLARLSDDPAFRVSSNSPDTAVMKDSDLVVRALAALASRGSGKAALAARDALKDRDAARAVWRLI